MAECLFKKTLKDQDVDVVNLEIADFTRFSPRMPHVHEIL
jgi:hypothetical protein